MRRDGTSLVLVVELRAILLRLALLSSGRPADAVFHLGPVIRPPQSLLASFSADDWRLSSLRDGEIFPSTVIGFPEKVRNVRLTKAALRLLSRADGEGLVAFD